MRVFKTVCARSLLQAYLSGDLSWWSWEEDEDFIIILSFTKLLRDFELQWTHCLSITSSSEVEKSSISWDHPRKIPTVVYLIIYSTFYSLRKMATKMNWETTLLHSNIAPIQWIIFKRNVLVILHLTRMFIYITSI